ncbi:hypothetical protein [Paraburkholderia sp. MM5496-R1]|uniref:hypothetical protein n=1 Tax=Paraburkholderia sp. MM5496-R1 TaxID=2991065 RepID=UPI003D25AFE6
MVLEKRYWPTWDVWAEQAGEMLTKYEQQGRGRRPDALLVACNALVVMRWRGCPAFEPLLWTTVKANGQYLLACGKSVTPDGGRAQRLIIETLARAYPNAWARSEGVGAARPRSGAPGTGSFSQAEQAA